MGPPTYKTHRRFNAPDADVVFQSSDGVRFHIHRKNLEAVTGAFPGPEWDTRGEIVHLTEAAFVLEAIFDYVYPCRHTDFEDKDFESIAAISEAVEKYEVFPAMNPTLTRLRHFTREHPLEVLVHAIKHDYPRVMDEAAPHLICSPLVSIFEKLPLTWAVIWLKYYDTCRDCVFGSARHYLDHKERYGNCHQGFNWLCNICRSALLAWVASLEHLDSRKELEAALDVKGKGFPQLTYCGNCHDSCMHMSGAAEKCKEGLEKLPRLTSFVPGGERRSRPSSPRRPTFTR